MTPGIELLAIITPTAALAVLVRLWIRSEFRRLHTIVAEIKPVTHVHETHVHETHEHHHAPEHKETASRQFCRGCRTNKVYVRSQPVCDDCKE
jgi:hypothetical protein